MDGVLSGRVRATTRFTAFLLHAYSSSAATISVAIPAPREPLQTEYPISTEPWSSGGPKNPPLPTSRAACASPARRIAYHVYQPAACVPPFEILCRKNRTARSSYSLPSGGHSLGRATPSCAHSASMSARSAVSSSRSAEINFNRGDSIVSRSIGSSFAMPARLYPCSGAPPFAPR